MAGSSAQTAEKRQATKGLGDDPLDALLARLIVAPQANTYDRMNSGADDNGDSTSGRRLARGLADGSLAAEKRDPWDVLTEEMNDEISRQIFDELDKQLDQQMMAELEKCHDEHSRQMDEELDRQLQQQLDEMLEASCGTELIVDEQGEYDYFSDDGEEEEELEVVPWSEGGDGGIASLGLRQVPIEFGGSSNSDAIPGSILGTRKYTQEELQKMVNNLYGEGGGDKVAGPGAWGKAKWRPSGDRRDRRNK